MWPRLQFELDSSVFKNQNPHRILFRVKHGLTPPESLKVIGEITTKYREMSFKLGLLAKD